jgi:hypothetical protein
MMITEREVVTAMRGRGLTWDQVEAETYLKESYLRRWYGDIPRAFVKVHSVRSGELVSTQRSPPASEPPTRNERHLTLLRASRGRF